MPTRTASTVRIMIRFGPMKRRKPVLPGERGMIIWEGVCTCWLDVKSLEDRPGQQPDDRRYRPPPPRQIDGAEIAPQIVHDDFGALIGLQGGKHQALAKGHAGVDIPQSVELHATSRAYQKVPHRGEVGFEPAFGGGIDAVGAPPA